MFSYFVQFITLILVVRSKCFSIEKDSYLLDKSPPENGISEYIISKGYLPKESELPKSSIIKNIDNDVTYLLSKLSDDELIRLLNEKPNKNIYDLNDVVQIAFGKQSKDSRVPIILKNSENLRDQKYKSIQDTYSKDNSNTAFFKLDQQQIYPEKQNNKANFLALNKLNNLLVRRPRDQLMADNLNDEKRELLFDILVAQLRALCCKSSSKKLPLEEISNIHNVQLGREPQKKGQRLNEFMFLIVNDEVKNNANDDDLITVDPDTLEKNSSVLLLGPITTPLTDGQLKVVMNRISTELSKPEYSSLLKQLSEGTVSNTNISLMKNFIFGPETRRYIKAHRCNHQAKLSKVYGGPKWLLCTGYLNVNRPSLYD
ncbi:unnamed protein product [Danaus chrysippus]|uniref:(African queen) hypothetical protein n=1 Tax=Danaus chrysippus TaxID=151541 RepID=A0A8J2R3G2_9NEOP|nr:unnamed protein product [Danaus chrysippus]